MRVLIFSTAYFPHIGGAEVAVKEITDRVSDVDFDMITIRLNRKDLPQEKVGNINIYRIGFGLGRPACRLGRIDKLLFPFLASRLANKLHKKNKYDIAWSIMASFSGFATLFFKKKNSDVKFLLTLQEGDDLKEPVRKSFLVNFWFKQIFTRADHIQVISKYLAEWAKKMNASCPIEVVPNGVLVKSQTLPTLPTGQAGGRQESKVKSHDEKVVLTTSRLVKKNGIEDLIIAFAQLLELTTYNLQLTICGDGELSQKLKVQSQKLGIADKVEFKGFVKQKELEKYYAMADVFCRPSVSEGLGNSFLEAMAYEVPIVATHVGGIKDFLEHKKTGFVCEIKDSESIAKQIKYILDPNNKNEVEQVVKNAKEMVAEKYDWNKIALKIKNIFQKLV